MCGIAGIGGDELFAGYGRYFKAAPVVACSATVGRALYRLLVSQWPVPSQVVRDATVPRGPLDDPLINDLVPDPVERMLYLDTLIYLPDDILTKVDRASMTVSLEARVPLLDHRLVAFAWSLSPALKGKDGIGRRLLRRVIDCYVPRALVDRPKVGFAPPINAWLCGRLRDWAETLLDENPSQRRRCAASRADPCRLAETSRKLRPRARTAPRVVGRADVPGMEAAPASLEPAA